MTDKKLHYYILTASLILCAFMYIDAYWVPLKTNSEIVTNARRVMHYRSRGSSYYSFNVQTDQRNTYNATSDLYNDVNIGDTIAIQRSVITNSVQKISILRNSGMYIYDTGFIRVGTGSIYIFLNTVGIILLFIFYDYLNNIQGRRNLTYLLLVVSVILFICHLIINI